MPQRPIELQPPDLARWRTGNVGVDHVQRIDSGRAGPTVMLQALTHGNELCGAIALDWLLSGLLRFCQLRPSRPPVEPTKKPLSAKANISFA